MTRSEQFETQKRRMVETQLLARDITDPQVIDAMTRVDRHLFVDESVVDHAYEDRPLPIGYDQTISQPYVVALMTQLAKVGPQSRALDIGTGCGYQAAVLSLICDNVISIEIVPELAASARSRLQSLGYENVLVEDGDGCRGEPAYAPYDAIICAAAPRRVPQALTEQLAIGGHIIIPVGTRRQNLLSIVRTGEDRFQQKSITPVAFVPMTGAARRRFF